MSSANILVVDDEDSIRHFVSRSLKDEGYQVRSAGDGDEARALFNEDVPDVVILDMSSARPTASTSCPSSSRSRPTPW